MSWIYLVVAGLFETGWAIGLKHTDGFTRLWPSLYTLGAMAISIWLLAVAVRTLPIGTAYAIWTAIGAAGTAIIGMVFLGEEVSAARIACIGLIVTGTIGLKLVSNS